MVLGAIFGAGIGIVGGISVGSLLFAKKQPKDFTFLDVDMDGELVDDGGQTTGPVPRDLREALEFTPMWTRWPDYERVAWINYTIRVLWPHYNKAITEMVAQQLEPALTEQVRKIGVLEAIDMECLDLGTRPIRIGGIKVYETNEDEVILEAPILWGSNAKIRIAAKIRVAGVMVYVPVEVTDIVMKAESRITIKPLVETLPCLGSVSVSLLKEPFVDLSVMVINRLDLMALPIVRDIVQKAVAYTVGDLLVFPNQMSFDIMENGGRLPEPEGMLSIKLCRGFNLRGGEIFSKTDPFVVLEVREGRPVQSAVVANNTNPVWDEEFHLIVDDRAQQAITLTIKDEDFGWQDKSMGGARIPLEHMPFMADPLVAYEITIALAKGKKGKRGKPSKPEDRAPEGVVKAIRKREPNGQWSEVALDPKLTVDHDVSPAKGSRGKEKDRGSIVIEAKFHPFNRAAMAANVASTAAGDAGAVSKKATALQPQRTFRRMDSVRLRDAKGVMTVTLTRCINLQGDNTTDPQVEISVFDDTADKPIVQTSSVVFNEQSPRWGDKFDFVGISADSFVVFNVRDCQIRDKPSLGKLRIPVQDVVRNVRIKDVWALQETQQGEIALTLEWKPLTFGEDEPLVAGGGAAVPTL